MFDPSDLAPYGVDQPQPHAILDFGNGLNTVPRSAAAPVYPQHLQQVFSPTLQIAIDDTADDTRRPSLNVENTTDLSYDETPASPEQEVSNFPHITRALLELNH